MQDLCSQVSGRHHDQCPGASLSRQDAKVFLLIPQSAHQRGKVRQGLPRTWKKRAQQNTYILHTPPPHTHIHTPVSEAQMILFPRRIFGMANICMRVGLVTPTSVSADTTSLRKDKSVKVSATCLTPPPFPHERAGCCEETIPQEENLCYVQNQKLVSEDSVLEYSIQKGTISIINCTLLVAERVRTVQVPHLRLWLDEDGIDLADRQQRLPSLRPPSDLTRCPHWAQQSPGKVHDDR